MITAGETRCSGGACSAQLQRSHRLHPVHRCTSPCHRRRGMASGRAATRKAGGGPGSAASGPRSRPRPGGAGPVPPRPGGTTVSWQQRAPRWRHRPAPGAVAPAPAPLADCRGAGGSGSARVPAGRRRAGCRGAGVRLLAGPRRPRPLGGWRAARSHGALRRAHDPGPGRGRLLGADAPSTAPWVP